MRRRKTNTRYVGMCVSSLAPDPMTVKKKHAKADGKKQSKRQRATSTGQNARGDMTNAINKTKQAKRTRQEPHGKKQQIRQMANSKGRQQDSRQDAKGNWQKAIKNQTTSGKRHKARVKETV